MNAHTTGRKSTGSGSGQEPLSQLKAAMTKMDDTSLRQACLELSRELRREYIFYCVLDGCLGMHAQPRWRTTDGGWMSKPQKAARIVALLSSHSKYSWNIYHLLDILSRDREGFALDIDILPIRTRYYLDGDPSEANERLSTENSKRLYEYFFFARTRPHAIAPTSGSGVAISQNGSTRLPFVIPHLDFYHFIFAYWAVCPKSGTATTSPHPSLSFLKEIASKPITPASILANPRVSVYCTVLRSYLLTYFTSPAGPDLDRKGGLSDPVKALALNEEAEKFLRIFIEMWLERNPVHNPDAKTHVESSDNENQILPVSRDTTYEEPTLEILLALLLWVPYLLARKVEVEVMLQGQGSRGVRASPAAPAFCPALDALQQPVFIFLALGFRRLRIEKEGWLKFLLLVELWLSWLTPSEVTVRLAPGKRSQDCSLALRWQQSFLKAYVVSNFHFYTTLYVLYMRKVREALGADASMRSVVLVQLARVLKAVGHPDLREALLSVSRTAHELWQAGSQLRGRILLTHHLHRLRLTRSKPCLWRDTAQDAHHLAAELLAIRKRAVKAMEDLEHSWRASLIKVTSTVWLWIKSWVSKGACDSFGLVGRLETLLEKLVVGPGLTGDRGGASSLPSQIDDVLEELYEIFPSVRMKCQQSLREDEADAQLRDPDRRGILLTERGREQLLAGQRACDPSKAVYMGDPLFDPVLASDEYGFLLPWAQRASIWLSKKYKPSWQSGEEREKERKRNQHGTGGEQNSHGTSEEKASGRGDESSVGDEWGHVEIKETKPTDLAPLNLRWMIRRWVVLSAFIVLLAVAALLVMPWGRVQAMLAEVSRAQDDGWEEEVEACIVQ